MDRRLSETLDPNEEDAITLAKLSKSPKKNTTFKSLSSTRTSSSKGTVCNSSDLNVEKQNLGAQVVSGRGRRYLSLKPSTVINGVSCASGQARSSAVIRAQEILLNFESEFPGFVKSLVRSHVAGCFWMGLPGPFCKTHLPKKDTMITLEDESGKQWGIKYIAYKTGLSAGWRQFTIAQKLLEGDVLVFQLLETTKFKVYIIRANDLDDVDGALGLLNLDSHTKPSIAAVDNKSNKKRPESIHSSIVQIQKKNPGLVTPVRKRTTEQSENDSEEVSSGIVEGANLSGSGIRFKDVKSFDNFRIVINGTILDSMLSDDTRRAYYKLCRSQNAFLHENVISGMNKWLILGSIAEIVTIADAVKASPATTSHDEFSTWEKSLRAFELLGMDIGFLHAQVSRLAGVGARSFAESPAEAGLKDIEVKLAELKEACDRYGGAIQSVGS